MIDGRKGQRDFNPDHRNAVNITRNTIIRLVPRVFRDNLNDRAIKAAGAILGAKRPNGQISRPINMPPGSKVGMIEQEVTILGATPHQVFEVLMDQQQHAALTKGEAQISRRVGGSFSTFDGWASGKQLELVPDTKIVQTWRAEDWPIGVISTCVYVLSAVRGGTKVNFQQTGIPKTFLKSVSQGWHDYYWEPLQALFVRK